MISAIGGQKPVTFAPNMKKIEVFTLIFPARKIPARK